MDVRWLEGMWWVWVDGVPYRHATTNEVFEFAAELQYSGLENEQDEHVVGTPGNGAN